MNDLDVFDCALVNRSSFRGITVDFDDFHCSIKALGSFHCSNVERGDVHLTIGDRGEQFLWHGY